MIKMPKFDILSKPPPEGDNLGWFRWFYRICEILNGQYPWYRTGITTHDISTATGVVNVPHGLGRIPNTVKVTGCVISSSQVTQQVFGVYDGINHSGMSIIHEESTGTPTADSNYTSTAFEIGFSAASVNDPYTGTNRTNAVITADATNIIFSWTKTGTVASATASILWEAL